MGGISMNIVTRQLGLIISLLSITVMAFAGDTINPHGKPINSKAGEIEHYAVWQDGGGWHIRTTTKMIEHHFRGVVSVKGGEFADVKAFRLEGKGAQKDLFIEGPEHHVINFDFSTKGSIDGVDFRVKGKEPMLSFTLMIGEKEPKFESGRIFIGKNGDHPSTNPFEIPAHGK